MIALNMHFQVQPFTSVHEFIMCWFQQEIVHASETVTETETRPYNKQRASEIRSNIL